MEGVDTLKLLEEVLCDMIHDPKVYASKILTLHLMLTSSSYPVVIAAGIISTKLEQQKKINDRNYAKFQKYIQGIISGNTPKFLKLMHSCCYAKDLAQPTNFFQNRMEKKIIRRFTRALRIVKSNHFLIKCLSFLKWKYYTLRTYRNKKNDYIHISSNQSLKVVTRKNQLKIQLLRKIIKTSVMHYLYLKHSSFTKYRYLCLQATSIQKLLYKYIFKEKRKMISKSRTLQKSKSSDHLNLNSSKIKFQTSILKKMLIQTSIRHHYINLMFFRRWLNTKMTSNVLDSEENLQQKSHDVTIPHDSIIPNLDFEADDTIETIFSRTVHLKGIPRPTRKKLLRSSRRVVSDHIIQLEDITKYMQKVSIVKKKMPRRFLKIWAARVKRLEKTREICRNVIYGLIRKRNINKKLLRNALKVIKESNKNLKFNSENEGLSLLAHKAFEVKNAKKIIVMLWREKVKKGYNIKAFRLAVRTMMKLRKAIVHPWVKIWKKVISDEIIKKNKALLIAEMLNRALAKSIQKVINMIKSGREFKVKREEKLLKVIEKNHQRTVERLKFEFYMFVKRLNYYQDEKIYKVEKMLEKIVDGFTENAKKIFKHIRREKKNFAIKKKNVKKNKLRASAHHTPNLSMKKPKEPEMISHAFIKDENIESFVFIETLSFPKENPHNPNLQKAMEFLESNYKSAKLRRLSFVMDCFKLISGSLNFFNKDNKSHIESLETFNNICYNHKISYPVSINNNEYIPQNLDDIDTENQFLLEPFDENTIDTPGCFVW